MRKKAVISLVLLSLAAAGCGRQADSVTSSAAASLEEAASQDTPASLEESVSRDASAPGTLIEKIEWDADGDGKKEKMFFDYAGAGGEEPGFMAVSLYTEAGEIGGIISRCSGVREAYEKEDGEGPYLEVVYAQGEEDPEGQCTIRLRDGALEIAPCEP